MDTYTVRLTVQIVGEPPEATPQFAEQIFDELLTLQTQVDMAGPEEPNLYTFWVDVLADGPEQAVVAGGTLVRTAGHAAGGRTHAWPSPDAWPDYVRARQVEAYLSSRELVS
jgi:hypothetical protein